MLVTFDRKFSTIIKRVGDIMIELFRPDIYQKSIYHIDYDKLKESGIKCLFFDLDNTLVPFVEKEPNKRLINFINDLKDMDFKVIIFSNASKNRLKPFKDRLLVDCSYNSRKPFSGKFLRVIKKFNYNISDVAIIGDQVMTDVLGGNKVGITTILVNPMSNKDRLATRIFCRSFERKVLNILEKRGIFKRGKYYD